MSFHVPDHVYDTPTTYSEQYKSSGRLPSVNDIIDNWVLDGNKVGDVVIEHNVRMQPTGFSECVLIDAKLTMHDVKPYERQVVFSPHANYDKMTGIMLESQIINIPKRQQTMHLKIPARCIRKHFSVAQLEI